MGQGEEFDERITSVERQVRIAREDSAAARVLAGGADRDVAGIGATLKRHEAKLDRHEVKLDRQAAKLDRHEAKLDQHTVTLDQHTVTLEKHTVTLEKHTVTLAQHGAKLDMHKALLDALREIQIEQGKKIDSLEQRMSRGFSMLAVGQAEILALLNRIDDSSSG